MPHEKGEYFADKKEAIEFYRNSEKNLADKPDWLIECIIDFAIQYPNYKEYCEVEARVKNGKELTVKQKKKYGHLKWEKDSVDYKEGQVLEDHVEINAEGTYDDIARDPVAREKYNKYNLQFGESLEPNKNVAIRMDTGDGLYEATGNVDELNSGKKSLKECIDIKKIEDDDIQLLNGVKSIKK